MSKHKASFCILLLTLITVGCDSSMEGDLSGPREVSPLDISQGDMDRIEVGRLEARLLDEDGGVISARVFLQEAKEGDRGDREDRESPQCTAPILIKPDNDEIFHNSQSIIFVFDRTDDDCRDYANFNLFRYNPDGSYVDYVNYVLSLSGLPDRIYFQIDNLPYNFKYKWRVQAYGGGHASPYTSSYFFMSESVPSAPTISGSVSSGHPRLTWGSVNGAYSYKVREVIDATGVTNWYNITSSPFVGSQCVTSVGVSLGNSVYYNVYSVSVFGEMSVLSNSVVFRRCAQT